jgi:hypothetical protein
MTIGGVPIRCQSASAVCASFEALIFEQFTTVWENFQENLRLTINASEGVKKSDVHAVAALSERRRT